LNTLTYPTQTHTRQTAAVHLLKLSERLSAGLSPNVQYIKSSAIHKQTVVTAPVCVCVCVCLLTHILGTD